MGFSLKLAPGVRVRVSSHGVRAGIGPRVARVHVGTGRTGFSSGLGPLSVYAGAGTVLYCLDPGPAYQAPGFLESGTGE